MQLNSYPLTSTKSAFHLILAMFVIILGSLSHVLQGLNGCERCESQIEHAQSRAKERERKRVRFLQFSERKKKEGYVMIDTK